MSTRFSNPKKLGKPKCTMVSTKHTTGRGGKKNPSPSSLPPPQKKSIGRRQRSRNPSSLPFTVPESNFQIDQLEETDLDFFQNHPAYLDHFHLHLDRDALTKRPTGSDPASYTKNTKTKILQTSLTGRKGSHFIQQKMDEDSAFQNAVGSVQLNPDPDEPTFGSEVEEEDDGDEIHQVLVESDDVEEQTMSEVMSGEEEEEEEEEEEIENLDRGSENVEDVFDEEEEVEASEVDESSENEEEQKVEASEDLSSSEKEEEQEVEASEDDESFENKEEDTMEQETIYGQSPKNHAQRKRKAESDDDEDAEYEVRYQQTLLKTPVQPKSSIRLPIKMPSGQLVRPNDPTIPSPPSSEHVSDTNPSMESVVMGSPPSPPPAHPPHPNPVKHMALLAETLLQDPHHHVTSSLPLLLTYLNNSSLTDAVRSMAILVLCQVFLDLIPGYSIQELTSSQRHEKVTKEIKLVRQFEQHFLKSYQTYLGYLDKLIKIDSGSRLSKLSLLALCRLLERHPHFNFRKNLLHTLLHHDHGRTSRVLVVATLVHVFRHDEEGHVSNEAVRILGRRVKQSKYKVHPDLLRTLEQLRLKDELTLEEAYLKRPSSSAPSGLPRTTKCTRQQRKLGIHRTPYMNRKQGKQNKYQREAEASLKLAQASVDVEDRKRHHRVCLEHLFLTYFRVLKHASHTRLLLPVLDGLHVFAHLISVDFFHSLLAVLRSHLSSMSVRPAHQLAMLRTLHVLAKGQGELIHLDVSSMYTTCYQLIHTLRPWSSSLSSTLRLLCEFLDDVDLFRNAPSVSTSSSTRDVLHVKRVAAFFIQWLHFLLLLDHPHWLLAALSVLHGWLRTYPSLSVLFDRPCERCFSGPYQHDTQDPLLANALSATPWPFHLLLHHWHPEIRCLTQTLLRNLSSSSTTTKRMVPIPSWTFFCDRWDWKNGKDALICFHTTHVQKHMMKVKNGEEEKTKWKRKSKRKRKMSHREAGKEEKKRKMKA